MDLVSTHGGRVGFRVRFANGAEFTEAMGTWDDVPEHQPIAELSVIDLRTGVPVVRLADMPLYFFCNEALGSSGVTVHTAKILGGVNMAGDVSEVRVELLTLPDGSLVPAGSTRHYHESDFPFERALRPGLIQQVQ